MAATAGLGGWPALPIVPRNGPQRVSSPALSASTSALASPTSKPSGQESTRRAKGGMRSSISSPALMAAYELRQFSAKKNKLGFTSTLASQQFPHDSVKDRERRQRLAELQSKWRQREEDERGLEAAEAKRQAKIEEKQREIDRAERISLRAAENRRRGQLYRQEMEERQRNIREREERERKEREERERKVAEAKEALRIRRIPQVCDFCCGTGKCPTCGGSGDHFAFFFTASVDAVDKNSHKQYGAKQQGCETCLGFKPGILGKAVIGSGDCIVCGGAGKFCTLHCEYGLNITTRDRAERANKARHAFNLMDTDKDGEISLEEAQVAGVSEKLFSKIDVDGSGGLCKYELMKVLAKEKTKAGSWSFCKHCRGCIDPDRLDVFDGDDQDVEQNLLDLGVPNGS